MKSLQYCGNGAASVKSFFIAWKVNGFHSDLGNWSIYSMSISIIQQD